MVRLYFYPVGGSVYVLIAVALVLLGLLAVGPGARRASLRRRRILAALRGAAFLAVLFAMLRPTIVYTQNKPLAASILILADLSRSMTVPDEVSGLTRYEALKRALEDSSGALRRLGERFNVKAYGFDRDARRLEVVGGRVALPEKPEGRATAIGRSLDTVLRQEAGERLLGVFLLSDGAQRALPPDDLLPQQAAAQLRSRGDKLWTLRLGKTVGLGQARDLAVKEVLANDRVFVNNELAVRGRVRMDGFVNRPASVRLLFESAPERIEPVAVQTVTAKTDGEEIPFEFLYAPATPGEHKLTVEVVEQPGELVTTNNRVSTFVNVLKGGLRVLYLEGFPPRVEQNFLRRALDASPDINVDTFTIDPRRPETRPADLGERLKPGRYEAYILGDLDSSAFEAGELQNLADTVSRGAGLIMLGGWHSFGASGYAEHAFGRCPAGEDESAGSHEPIDSPPRTDLHLEEPVQMTPTEINLGHFTMLLGTKSQRTARSGRSCRRWRANKFFGMKPLASVLAEWKKEPLWSPTCLAAAAWWVLRATRRGSLADAGVWQRAQAILAAGGALARARRRVARGQCLGGTAAAAVPAWQPGGICRPGLAATGEPVIDATGEALVTLPDGKREKSKSARRWAAWGGRFARRHLGGDYSIEVRVSHGDGAGTARARFLVADQDLELDNAAADAGVMDGLAAMTEPIAGGEELPSALEGLVKQAEMLVETTETKLTLWDTWFLFLLLIGLLGVEWYLRKRWGLV